MRAHGLGKEDARNVRKQSNQIRQCLTQAKEYFRAANAVSLATKPLLLYYGVMSLALAQILMKGNGDVSLDKARGEHAHHGLVLKHSCDPATQINLAAAAQALKAVPHVGQAAKRVGTFELWHKLSRETPLVGRATYTYRSGASTTGIRLAAAGRDERMELLPARGISLLECFQNAPGMRQILPSFGIQPQLARARIEIQEFEQDESSVFTIVLQPDSQSVLDRVCENCFFEPRLLHQVEIVELRSGYIIRDKFQTGTDACGATYPNAFQITDEDLFFSLNNQSLNEFGVLYAGIYILGNYARYYPDQWMKDVEQSSDLALAVETFIKIVEERAALLTLSELSQVYFVRS